MKPQDRRTILFRLQWIIEKFRNSKGAITAGELAKEYEVTTKTIYRDIEFLRNTGAFKVTTSRDGANVRGYLLDGPTICPFCKK